MRVAQITTDWREFARAYQQPQPSFGTAPEALLQGFALMPEVEVHIVACLQQPVAPKARIAPNIFYHGLHVPKFGWLRTGYQGCLRAIRRTLQEIKPDLVHGQGTERECALAAALSRRPGVITVHGNMRMIAKIARAKPFTYAWLAARLEAWTLPRASGVVCITNYTRDLVASLAKRTWVVPNAVDAAFFAVQPAPSNPPVVLVVGQICERKNQNAFIRALEPLAHNFPFKILFLGGLAQGDPYAEEFKTLVAARPWCEHGGFANRAKLRDHLRSASVLALPSLEDNCPMVVLEAMAASVPVAAARVGGVPELIDPGRTGVLFDPLDPISMMEAMRSLLGDPAKRATLRETARAEALQRFHPQVIARRHLEIYREVLSNER
jgi:glycosyltransferase involved in cell wall biosynthesis